ncbi:DASH complex subunit Dad3 [Penicillium capsulatum]|uniref:DASH complex subunit DAD3 n=1 Tax=Penicillium capsulatum TaxID=69766 RepID=A0A9W9LMM3_9EURO|nr:DASH complex subunit Dad3 [Penicillium capsulatum]KAJ6108718.1 DASH complex subunit Dad3 [Penicillium capsulatum]
MSAFAAADDPETTDCSYVSPDPASTTLPAPEQPTSSDPDRNPSNNPLLGNDNSLVSDLEQEVLDEYTRLLRNVNQLSDKVSHLAGSPASMTLDGLRLLERKTATVCTLLKASVYSIVLQQQIWNESEEQQQQQQASAPEHGYDREFEGAGYDGQDDMTFQ